MSDFLIIQVLEYVNAILIRANIVERAQVLIRQVALRRAKFEFQILEDRPGPLREELGERHPARLRPVGHARNLKLLLEHVEHNVNRSLAPPYLQRLS